ncbi:MAG: excinuclease ABC subunit UvrC [Actinomycetales bacterium]|nr:MAG: excinuclease ABC subunit UvrC [Actinomycetales bacterium]
MADPQSYRPSSIPTDPGVYRFFDEKGVVIYVGKAKNLKNRLNSYFQKNLQEKTYRMVNTAVRVDWTVVNTEIEALQLEFTWIKSENPKYNIQFKDDKSYPYLAVSLVDEFPRLFISRAKRRPGVKYFGPYAHAWALRSSFDVIQKLYPIRSCTDSNFARAVKSKRQCLLGDIGKCSAPCVSWISKEEHQELAKKLVKFVDTSSGDISAALFKDMVAASGKEEFEQAAKIRDQISAIEKSAETSGTFLSENFSADLLATHSEITHSAVTMFSVRHGRVVGSRSWILDRADVLEDESVIGAMISKIYSELDAPSEILVDELPDTAEIIEDWLTDKSGHRVTISMPLRGDKLDVINTVKRNANQALIQHLSKRSNDAAVSGRALEEIANLLDLPELPLRIECFDISNIQGNHMVASMVVFEDGQIKKSDYRRFAIDDDAGFDDTRAMHHVLTRRLKRYLAEREIDNSEVAELGGARPKFAYPPQLIVVDGGAPQVAAAAKALAELGISDISLCGLAKRLEEVWLPESKEPIIFPRHSEGLYLLQRIRDEAHRFAITFHRSKRSKVMLESLLDDIPKLGESRRAALLDKFGSVTAIRKATVTEISTVPGIGSNIAELIVAHLASESASIAQVNMETGEIS